MARPDFLMFNVIGGIGWGVGVTLLGYFLGQVDFVKSNIEPIILGIVAISVLAWKPTRRGDRGAAPARGSTAPAQHVLSELLRRFGAAQSIPTPLNETIAALIKGVEASSEQE